MEIEVGLKLNPEREKKIRPIWNSLLEIVEVIPYTKKCAEATARIRSHLKNSDTLIGPYDILIAGTAIAHQMTVVTSNAKEFKRVLELSVEDWKLS